MINENFVWLGFALTTIGTLVYLRGIIRKEVKPNVVTWSLWATAPLLAFSAQLSEDAGLRAVHTFSTAFEPMLVVITALIVRNAFAKLKKQDYIFGLIAVTGLVLWQVTGEGVVAILFAMTADTFAALPTIRKLYKEPETESGWVFGFAAIAAVIALLTIKDWRFEEYGFSLYILIITSLMFFPTGKEFLQSKLNRKVAK